MAKYQTSALLLSVVILCLQTVTSEMTLTQLQKKVNNQGKKLTNLLKEVKNIKSGMEKMDSMMGTLGEKPPCSNNLEGFHFERSLGSCYRIEDISLLVNASQAEALCQSYSPESHLVAIESEKEHRFLKAMWNNQFGVSSISRFWTGGSLVDGVWHWSSGKVMGKYENWIPTTDHNDERFACLAVHANEAYWWVDVACWFLHAVTCEIAV